jgi:hypothetical protein
MDMDWSRIESGKSVFGGSGDQVMNSVVAFDSGYVVVGSDESGGDMDAAVWVSPDGLSWERVSHDESSLGGDGPQRMNDVVAGGPGLVAVGADGSGEGPVDAAVWTSTDGTTWEKVFVEALEGDRGVQEIEAIVVTDSRLVAVGWDGVSDGSAVVWTSDDGFGWSRVPLDAAVVGKGSTMVGVTVGGPGLVAIGSITYDPAVWVSQDGLAWSLCADGTDLARAQTAVTSIGDQIVAVGRTETSGGDFDAGVWTSRDAKEWAVATEDAQSLGGPFDQWVSGVDSGEAGIYAVGYSQTPNGTTVPAIWTSTDLVTWSSVPIELSSASDEPFVEVTDVVIGDTTGVAVGFAGTVSNSDGAVWIIVETQ